MTQFAGNGGDPLAAFDARLQQIKARAEEAQERLRTASATVRAPDGAVSVTVNASGVLQGITFTPAAYRRPPEALSELVMGLVATARKQVSAEVSGAFGDLVGEGSPAMEVLREFLPVSAEDEDEEGTPPPPPAPPRQQQRPPGRPSRPAEDDEDEDNNPW
ncbi:YbaB/EbfC family nucleoid-associated protein [Amycolatopsis alkalitolerans]|uniref:YbaB/EbfC family nucleoid-associated protein n=1 Tax=Amycolatopsis alkalitolerans TaxID=2547244 RepID=A0A5C4MAM8_9PSEU|nr:YbaB/EbfC family nucleoid-associated protein [Amycolatopsis alkalitolerans]TNC29071.1 YbaB/EbfC family nucleoid-associated protein [Amycolatopsis alkalitolerans]